MAVDELVSKDVNNLVNLNPKMMFKRGLTTDYHPGFTKQTLEKRKGINRKKNKQAKISRKNNR